MQKFLLKASFLLLVCAPKSHAIDYSLLVGEWSDLGKCDATKIIYTDKGVYKWIERNPNGDWITKYEGTYVSITNNNPAQKDLIHESGAIIISDQSGYEGYVVQIKQLNNVKLSGYWDDKLSIDLSFDNPKEAFFDYRKCK